MLWELLAARAPAALLTRIEGPGAGPAAQVVDRDGQSWGSLGDGPDAAGLVKEAVAALAAGRSSTRRIEDGTGAVLLEAWVPAPRLVVVGSGDMVAAIAAQGALLGWDCQATEDPARARRAARLGRRHGRPDRAQPRPARRHPGPGRRPGSEGAVRRAPWARVPPSPAASSV